VTATKKTGRLSSYEKWEKAREWCEIAVRQSQRIGRQDLTADAQFNLARVHEAEGRADLALPLAQEALKIYERLQHKDLVEVKQLVERLSKTAPPP